MTGQVLAHFEVLEKIGEGGMGAVYKARDTKLNRSVAIKVLRSDKVVDPERRRRFLQEARSASALNHPNIVTVHEIGQAGDVDFIAMELVGGRTLDQLIPRNGLRVAEALKYAIQIAGALTKAHAAGITHRDLKPSNIMVTGEGQVKVLDFGLAKLTEPGTGLSESAATRTITAGNQAHTAEGAVLGTVAYMSPEQAEGRPVDARSDIFSFGSVLYEMVTGHRAFHGETSMATLAAVINQEPKPIGEVAPAVPRDLEKVIGRCLRKDASRRAQHIADVKLALDEIREESESGSAVVAPASAPLKEQRPSWLIPVVVGAMLAAGASAVWMMNRPRPEPAIAASTPVVLTSYPGVETTPALSPDGKYIAFAWNGEKEDNTDIYVKLVDAGTPVRLTQDAASDAAPAWSPDGNFIAFRRLMGDRGAYYVIPALGGQERKIAELPQLPSHRSFPTVDWSPDGKSLVIVDTSVDPPSLALVSVATGEKRQLTTPPPKSLGDADPHISPDGKWLAFSRSENVTAGDWFVLPFGTGAAAPKRLTEFHGDIRCGATWTPSSDSLLACGSMSGERRLWRIQAAGGASQPVANLGEGDDQPTLSRQGARLAFRRAYFDDNLWLADLKPTAAQPIRIVASSRGEFQPDYSPDGSRIAFISSRTGRGEVWVANADGSNPLQLTTEGARPTAPRWSPDGKRIAFAKRPGGNVDVYVIDATGGAPRRLTQNPANEASAYWSRDGKWIYFASNRTGRQEVWRTPAEGGQEVQVTTKGGWRGRESLDGKTLVYQKFDLPGLWRIPVEAGEESKIADLPALAMWDSTGDASYWVPRSSGPKELRRIDHASGRETLVRTLPRETAVGTSNFTVAADGSRLVFVRTDQQVSDLMLVENFH